MKTIFKQSIRLIGGVIFLLSPYILQGQVENLLRDDFDGETLSDKWTVRTHGATETLGRTRFDAGLLSPTVSEGALQVSFETFNPSPFNRSNTLFLGTEILTNESYSLDMSPLGIIDFEIRLRLIEPIPNGLVAAFFIFEGTDPADEIDIELVSNLFNVPNQVDQEIFINIFDDSVQIVPEEVGRIDIPTVDLTEFNTYRIRWEADKIEWYLNDNIISTQTGVEGLADSEMDLRLNFWAPESTFGLAFSEDLQTATSAEEGERFTFEVDHISINAIPEPEHLALYLGLSVFLTASVIRRIHKKRA